MKKKKDSELKKEIDNLLKIKNENRRIPRKKLRQSLKFLKPHPTP